MNPVQSAKMLYHFARLVRDPSRLGEVFEIAETLVDTNAMAPIVDAFRATPEGARALRERPRIGRVDMKALRALPEGTLGRAFAAHLDRNGLDPNALPMLEHTPDDGMYAHAHLYETHDVWHAVTGFGADVAGELGLQAFYLAQMPAKLGTVLLSLGLLNTFLYAFDERDARMREITRGWLLGRRAKTFLGMDWKALWTTPLSEVRARLNVDVDGIDATVTQN
jgi:ubiquinone biosynthesis protein COQ4